MSLTSTLTEAAEDIISGAREANQFMDWQQKYFDNLELHIKDIKDELRKSEDRISLAIRDAMQNVYIHSDQRHREYQNVSSRMNEMMAKIDKKQDDQNRWILRTAIAVIIGVAGLVSTGIIGLVKFIEMVPKP
jgi:uncharacterized FlaG/YvyC family protein